MNSPVISVRGLGKKYRMGFTLGHDMLRDKIASSIKLFLPRLYKNDNSKSEIRVRQTKEFWALRNISFDVQLGEVLGIIGANGAGKSTLLKLLSNITEPTEGEICLKGRVSSLLEVGTGFHPELSGRENIFMNGAILGMTRAEIKKKFDEIVSFAEVERFIDTPVKRYSSGMYVRLAFAVAAHLEPEILLVDEVLAVGDAAFQRKCLGKMDDVSRGGRTVLFVSHNMGAIAALCQTVILLTAGQISYKGEAKIAISKYLVVPTSSGDVDLSKVKDRTGNGWARFVRVLTKEKTGRVCDTFTIGDDILIDFHIHCNQTIRAGRMSLQVTSAEGIPIYHLVAVDAGFELNDLKEEAVVRVTLKNQKLYPGEYYVSLWLATSAYEALDRIDNAFKFTVIEGGIVVTRLLDRSSAVVHEIPEWTRIV